MATKEPILSARDVEIQFSLRGRKLTAIRKCSLDLYEGETLAIVGESGSGKSVFTKSFIGANGIHPFHGFTTVDTDEAMLKKEAVNHSYVSYVLADHTKFGKVTAVTFAPLEKACIVTDGIVKDKYKELTLIKEVHVE